MLVRQAFVYFFKLASDVCKAEKKKPLNVHATALKQTTQQLSLVELCGCFSDIGSDHRGIFSGVEESQWKLLYI